MPSYKINHLTRYTYPSPVIDGVNQIMLYPIEDSRLEVKHHEIRISGNPEVNVYTDYFGNKVGVFSLTKPHKELVIESVSEVETLSAPAAADEVGAPEQWQHLQSLKDDILFMDFLTQETFPSQEEMKEALRSVIDFNEKPLKNALGLSEYVYNNFLYQKGVTSIETPIEEVWKLQAGVCQDFAHILLVMLRLSGVPARYISGYICPKDEGVRGVGATHAWVEVYIPFYGWLGLDPTNNTIVTDGHVRIALGRNFNDCTPIKGTYKGSGDHVLEVTVNIENGHYTADQPFSAQPSYTYEVKNPVAPVNSYRHYLEMQAQQQQ